MRATAAIGLGQTAHRSRRPDVTLGELAMEAILPALADGDTSWEDIDAVVFGTGPDLLQGAREAYLTALMPLLGAEKPIIRVHTGGATGGSVFQAASLLVASGDCRRVLAVGLEKASEPEDVQAVLNTMWEPLYEEPIGLNAINMMSLIAVRQMHVHGYSEEDFAAVAVKNRSNGARNPAAQLRSEVSLEEVMGSMPIAYPIKALECCPRSDGACAVVVADEEIARRAEHPVWVQGMAECTDSAFIGDRLGSSNDDYIDANNLRRAAHEAYAQAGVADPLEDIDVAEVYSPFPCAELKAVEALGLCERGRANRLIEEEVTTLPGRLPVNPSGGPMCANPIGATGLVRIAECVSQLRGEAGEHQAGTVRRALATSSGGSDQFFTVVVLGEEKP